MKTKERSSRMRSIVVSMLLVTLSAVTLWSGFVSLKTGKASLRCRNGDPLYLYRKSEPIKFWVLEALRFTFSSFALGGAFFLLKSEMMRPNNGPQEEGEN
jgi:hypothetical protein